jgi:hypothetical protein
LKISSGKNSYTYNGFETRGVLFLPLFGWARSTQNARTTLRRPRGHLKAAIIAAHQRALPPIMLTSGNGERMRFLPFDGEYIRRAHMERLDE